MNDFVKGFEELIPKLQNSAGGKGSMLARMYQKGFPVPYGFVILPSAFENGKLKEEASDNIKLYLDKMRKKYEAVLFAVRSSAASEDSAKASFAGEFETVLNVKTDEEIFDAVDTVISSGKSERVRAYSSHQGMDESHMVAVVIQLMVQSEISGVLFTADPITGSLNKMTGNYVHGLGEMLVSGEANASTFSFIRPQGKYEGPKEFQRFASELYDHAANIEKEYGGPQDIEWAEVKGRLYILQARPITTLRTIDYDTYEVNESLKGDFLWTSNNVGEALPDVMTPFTWSLIRELDIECQKITGYYLWSGNICGRAYSNISMILSLMPKFGISMDYGKKLIGDVFGNIPENIEIPLYPFARLELIKDISSRGSKSIKRIKEAQKQKEYYLEHTAKWCDEILKRITECTTNDELNELWGQEIRTFVSKLWAIWLGGASSTTLTTLRKRLVKLVGEEDANLLLSNFRGDKGLESLGPLTGIMKVYKGEVKAEEYMRLYGHRSPHEFEMSIPYPCEDKSYIERQITEYKKSGVDVEALLDRQHKEYALAKERFIKRYPSKQSWLEKSESKIVRAAQDREALRSEFVKTFRVMRFFMLKLGELSGISEDVFFLYSFEVPMLLSGDRSMLKRIDARKKNYERYKTLPIFPQFIRGRFDPFEWAKSDNRRLDYYDSYAESDFSTESSSIIKGFAGAAGKVEGKVRVLSSFEESGSFLPGEILVASTTNVGWTPIFPKAAAIITDIGAPLSHAAIVARELGIPAVVGCGSATLKLKTGDLIKVDGGKGVVEILKQE